MATKKTKARRRQVRRLSPERAAELRAYPTLSVTEAAELARVGRHAIYRAMDRSGCPRPTAPGGRIPTGLFLAWLTSGERVSS